MKKQMIYWQKSSQIIKSSVNFAKENCNPVTSDIYFLNLPDSINGPPWNTYLFRSNLDMALNIDPKKIHYGRTVPFDEKVRNDTYLDKTQEDELRNKKELIFRFNNQTEQLELD